MRPSEVSAELRHIAAKIEASTAPSANKVRTALQNLYAQVCAEEVCSQEQQEQQQQGQQQEALPKSDAGKQMLADMLSQAEKALHSGDDAKFKSLLEKLQRSAV